jgi:hypothetical protein
VFGEPGDERPWGWRFGGHHMSLNNLVVDGVVVSTTPCFMGADPTSSPLLGGGVNRPLGRAPSDVATANRAEVTDGDRVLPLAAVWRDERLPDDGEQAKLQRLSDAIDDAAGLDESDHAALSCAESPKGIPGAEPDAGQRDLLRALLATYLERVPDGVSHSGTTTGTRSPPCTSPGPDRPTPAPRTTTGCRGPGCSSSGTTRSAAPTTRTRCDATRRPTSVSTCLPRTGRSATPVSRRARPAARAEI